MDRQYWINGCMAAVLLVSSPIMHAAEQETARALADALSCQRPSKPEDVFGLIRRLGGHAVIEDGLPEDVEVTLPNAIEIFGRPVSTIYIRPVFDQYGYYVEYGSLFDGDTVEAVGNIAGIVPDQDNVFRKTINGRELMLRPESGEAWIVCANEVNSKKRKFLALLRGIAGELSKPMKEGNISPAQEIKMKEYFPHFHQPRVVPEIDFFYENNSEPVFDAVLVRE